MLNFQLRLFKRFDGGWGKISKNGTWNGIVSNLHNLEADLGATGFTLCCQRTEVVDYLWSVSTLPAVFAIKSKSIT